MAFDVYLAHEFNHQHESKIFDDLVIILAKQYESDPYKKVVLIGNVHCENKEFDALLIKNDAITVIEFKSYGGEIHFNENGTWYADSQPIRGGAGGKNPYEQLRENRQSLINFIEKINEYFTKIDLGHVSTLLIFDKKITFFPDLMSHKIVKWFNVEDIYNVSKRIDFIKSPEIRLKDKEIELIVQKLNLNDRKYKHYKKITNNTQTFEVKENITNKMAKENKSKNIENIEELASWAYLIVKEYYDGKKGLSKKTIREEGQEILQQHGWSESESRHIFQPINKLIEGKGFTLFGSPKKVIILEHIITHILNDYKEDGLKNVITSLEETIKSGHGSEAMKELLKKLK
ncbi:nuclease-related domain-containing protein [Arcicella aquatica]|uniref:Nuclease-related domain-containing protein n=1 Tax=Arcicella aquatica TaxID=217141 RepID=A0ABU5QIF8_9BACT|nr:nuclease-related domain-containing protein [Arcicella aquatica]MEA5256831.1 nuclease-related domain-containing protein [Arcicella aquatica]